MQSSAYVYVRGGTSWSQQAELFASNGVAGREFVLSVAVDGDTIVVADFAGSWPLGRFNDVEPATHFAFLFIETLERSGVTGGCGNDNYCPDDPVTRAQMAVFLVRTFGL
jgi:hypothetical protein